MNEIKQRVETAASKMFAAYKKDAIGIMEADIQDCSEKCCEDITIGYDDVQKCVHNCVKPMDVMRSYLLREALHFQGNLNRCVMDCHDKVQNTITPDMSDTQQLQLDEEMVSCANSCADVSIKRLPGIYNKMMHRSFAME